MPDLVSVLIPLFGRHQGAATLGTVCAAWARQNVPCEVVVAVAGDIPVPVSGRVRTVRVSSSIAAPGTLRNHAAEQAEGDWLYVSDADVRPVGTDYLRRALRVADGGAMAQPWMLRRIGAAPADSGQDDLARDDDAMGRLSSQRCCFIQQSTADATPQPCADERYVWDEQTLMVVPPAALPVADGELRWRPPFHWGGMLVRRELFDAVGGYCSEYVGWGCEDDDLLAKISARTAVTVAWRTDPSLRCMHYEHARPYDTPGFAANQARLARRLAGGVDAMITADLGAGAVSDEE